MALKTNFTDDILAESMNGKRQYNVIENSNGTKSLEDVTDYQSFGSTFSAKDMNETNAAVNQVYDDMGDEFNPEVDYAVGDYAIRNNKVWKFTTAHPAGAWDESHVKATKILSEVRELTENLTEYVSMKYVSTGDSDVHIKFKIIDTSQLRAYITALITSQSGQPVMLTVSINIENNTIKSWNQITPINNSFGIQSVNIEEGGIQVKFNSVGVWGVCQYWGTGISI